MKEINLLIAEPNAKLQEEIKQRIKYEDSINLIDIVIHSHFLFSDFKLCHLILFN